MSENTDVGTPNTPNGWSIWSKYVLEELKRLNKCYDSLDKKIDTLSTAIHEKIHKNKEEIIVLKVKAGFWGLLGGFIPAATLLIVYFLKIMVAG